MRNLEPVAEGTEETCGCSHDEKDGHSTGYTTAPESSGRCGRPAAFTGKGGCNCSAVKRTYFYCRECKDEQDRYYGNRLYRNRHDVDRSQPGWIAVTEKPDACPVVYPCTTRGLRVLLVVPKEHPKSIDHWRVVIMLEGDDADKDRWISAFYHKDLTQAFVAARATAEANEWEVVDQVA